jgi:hypothetical protein
MRSRVELGFADRMSAVDRAIQQMSVALIRNSPYPCTRESDRLEANNCIGALHARDAAGLMRRRKQVVEGDRQRGRIDGTERDDVRAEGAADLSNGAEALDNTGGQERSGQGQDEEAQRTVRWLVGVVAVIAFVVGSLEEHSAPGASAQSGSLGEEAEQEQEEEEEGRQRPLQAGAASEAERQAAGRARPQGKARVRNDRRPRPRPAVQSRGHGRGCRDRLLGFLPAHSSDRRSRRLQVRLPRAVTIRPSAGAGHQPRA